MIFPEHYYYLLRTLRNQAMAVHPHQKLIEASGYEDVTRAILYTFDDDNQRELAQRLGFRVEQLEVYLMIIAAVARLERQVINGGWQ